MSADEVTRELIHARHITCKGYRRADGLWDIEGTLRDEKTYSFENRWRGQIEPGDAIHEMVLTLTLDEALNVTAVTARTLNSPYAICPTAEANYQKLVGLRIAPGWLRAVKERTGGREGCTHLTELLGPIATTAFQTILPLRMASETAGPGRRPRLLNSCVAYAEGGENARKLWPDWSSDKPQAEG